MCWRRTGQSEPKSWAKRQALRLPGEPGQGLIAPEKVLWPPRNSRYMQVSRAHHSRKTASHHGTMTTGKLDCRASVIGTLNVSRWSLPTTITTVREGPPS